MHERFEGPTVDRHSIRLSYLQEIVANFDRVETTKIGLVD